MNSNFLNHEINASEALTLYLKHYPRKNDIEFDAFYGAQSASTARALVRGLLDEAMSLRPDWSHMTLNDAGDFVEAEVHSRHPELSPKALECIGNYHTYLMRFAIRNRSAQPHRPPPPGPAAPISTTECSCDGVNRVRCTSPVTLSIAAAATERACTSRPTLVRSVNTGASHHCRTHRAGAPHSVTHEHE